MDDHSSVACLADARRTDRQNERQIVLVLQGGGALGAYHAGVYHALHEHGIEPDWIIGTSIGAINASLIAGNPVAERLPRLKEFWTRMAYRPPFGIPAWTGLADTISYWKTLFRGIPAFFEPNAGAFLGTHVPLGTDNAGFYSTAPLERTLLELVDFSLVNKCKPRLTVGAAHVRTSAMLRAALVGTGAAQRMVSTSQSSRRSVAALIGFGHRLHHAVEAEAARLHPRWKFTEAR